MNKSSSIIWKFFSNLFLKIIGQVKHSLDTNFVFVIEVLIFETFVIFNVTVTGEYNEN